MKTDANFDAFIDRLRSECDIVSVISEYVALKRKGKNYWGCCPFHNEKTPSFSVAPDKGFYYCFGCQAGGNVFNFLMKIENISFPAAVKLLAAKMNIPVPEAEKTEQERARDRDRARLYHINSLAADFFQACLTKTNYGKEPLAYLKRRGLNAATIETFRLGCAPTHWDRLVKAFSARGISHNELVAAGLAIERQNKEGIYDRFRNRVMFPIRDIRGNVIGFGGRVLDDSQPKYLNSPETALFNKRRTLYGIDIAHKFIKESGQAIVVEGYMDAISAHAAGVHNVVASLGTAFTPDQARLILKLAPEIIFAYDSDSAGQTATLRALGIIRNLGVGIRIMSVPDGKDPDEFIRKHGADAFRELVRNSSSLLDFEMRLALTGIDYSGLEGKVAVVARAVPALAEADNAVEVNAYIAKLAQTLAIDEASIRSELGKYIRANKKDKIVNYGKNNVVPVYTADTAEASAARHVIRLMCEAPEIVALLAEVLTPELIPDGIHGEIISLVLNQAEQPATVDVLLDRLSADAANELSRIMTDPAEYADKKRTALDCVRTLRLSYLNRLYETHRLRADELQRMGDSRFLQELAESQRINDEIKKIHLSALN